MRRILAIYNQQEPLAGFVARLRHIFPDSAVVPAYSWNLGLTESGKNPPDVILVGNGPGLEREQTCRSLKTAENTRHIPIILCDLSSGAPSTAPQEETIDEYIAQPLDDIQLKNRITAVIKLKNAEEQLRLQKKTLEDLVNQRTWALQKELEERKRVETELRRSEEKYRQLVHTSNDAIYFLYNQRFLLINEKFQQMYGLTIDDVNHPDFDLFDLVATRSRQALAERYQKIARGEPVESRYEFTALNKKGDEFEVEASVSFIDYKDGIATQGVIRDITERKKMESRLRRSEKIEAVTTLAGGIAHDFNNILAIIRGYTELAMEDLEGESQVRRNLMHVVSASDRARDLINQILVFSRQSEENRQPTSISAAVEEVLKFIHPGLPAYIKVKTRIQPETGTVNGDPQQIRQVIINLCSNALHAMRETGGVLEIALEEITAGPNGLPGFENAAPGPYVLLTVSDTGHGMRNTVAARIFDPYFTTKSVGEGSGMGLAVIYGIVKNYGGEIVVHTRLQEGTSFQLYLPCSSSRRKIHHSTKQHETQPLPRGSERILLVDDETSQTHFPEEMLENLGYQVVAVSRGIEALDIFRSDAEIFDIVIADRNLPDMNGLKMINRLLDIRPDIPILLSTGFDDNLSRDTAVKAGVKGFIMKPVVLLETATLIRNTLDKNKSN